MKRAIFFTTVIFFMAMLLFIVINIYTGNVVVYALAITAGTIFYHFAMRLLVGWAFHARFHNRMNYKHGWFRPRALEQSLYKFLRVKSWKKWVPTYEPDFLDLRKHSVEEVVQAMCQSELVHEVIMVLSLVPITFAYWFEELPVFVITSVAACLMDSVFVILQRYNRPRLLRLLK